jgi:hypothetical protein
MKNRDPYAIWARVLLDRFFGCHMAVQRTRLMVTRELLDEEFAHHGGAAAFVEAVTKGPAVMSGKGLSLHDTALNLWSVWEALSGSGRTLFDLPDGAPPYLPHLGILCLGWTIEDDDLAANAFYDRLENIVPDHGLDTNHLREWRRLWDGLKNWTANLEGKRGIFEVELLGRLAHVGIPLSQVLFTGPRIARLPEFFATTGLAGMARAGVVSDAHVRNVVADNQHVANQHLGRGMVREILGENELGKASIERLRDYLDDPDFRHWTPDASTFTRAGVEAGGGQVGPVVPTIPLRLVMEKIDNPNGWRCFFGVLGEDPPSDESGWTFRKVDNAFGGLWLASNRYSGDGFIDACEWGVELTEEVSVSVRDDSSNDAEKMALRLPRRPIRVFPVRWHGQMLVEDGTLPGEGGCFVLVGPAVQAEFRVWIGNFLSEEGIVSDYTLSGLRDQTSFFYLDKLERLGPALRNRFPAGELTLSGEPRRISLVGGSQVQSGGRQKAYLPFDLPEIVFDCPEGAELEVIGAELEELPSTSAAPDGFPGGTIRQYHFVGEAKEDIVTITSTSSNSTHLEASRFSDG